MALALVLVLGSLGQLPPAECEHGCADWAESVRADGEELGAMFHDGGRGARPRLHAAGQLDPEHGLHRLPRLPWGLVCVCRPPRTAARAARAPSIIITRRRGVVSTQVDQADP